MPSNRLIPQIQKFISLDEKVCTCYYTVRDQTHLETFKLLCITVQYFKLPKVVMVYAILMPFATTYISSWPLNFKCLILDT